MNNIDLYLNFLSEGKKKKSNWEKFKTGAKIAGGVAATGLIALNWARRADNLTGRHGQRELKRKANNKEQ